MEIAGDKERLLQAFVKEAQLAIEEDGADVIALAGAAMVGMDKKIEDALGVPVTDGVVSAVKLVEAQVAYKIRPSKRTSFVFPEKKEAIHLDDILLSVYK